MQINFSGLSGNERYHLMTQVIIPRPIAWVLSDNGKSGEGSPSYNLAPFSYFNAVSSEPPLVMISAGSKPSGEVKDTRANILSQKHCVIHIPSATDAQAVTQSSETLPHGDSEIDRLKLQLVNEPGWSLPRLADCHIAMAAAFYDVTEIGPNKQAIIFCELEKIYISDHVGSTDEKDRVRVDASLLSPLSRLGSSEYAELGKVFGLARPK